MARDINDTPNRVRYTATAAQTAFTVPFAFDAAANLKVWKNSSLLVLATHYTVAGAGGSSGTLTLLSGAALNDDILIIEDAPISRIGDFPVSGPFDVESLNSQLDAMTMMMRNLETRIERRSLRLGQTDFPETLGELPYRSDRANRVLAFDSNGNPTSINTASQSVTDAAASAASASSSAASAAASSASAGAASGRLEISTFSELATIFGYSTAGGRRDVAAGDLIHVVDIDATYRVLATDASAFDFDYTGTSGIKLNVMLNASRYSVRAFGAVADGTTDDTAAFQAAYDRLARERVSPYGIGRIYIPRGNYLVNGTVSMTSAISTIVVGDGPDASQIIRTVDTGNLFTIGTYVYVEFADIGFRHRTTNNRSTWTTNCFRLSGTGGGREFCLRRVETDKFNRIINFESAVGNEDTNYFEGCTFNHCKTFLYVRNSQSVVNKAVQCTWFGYMDRVFDIGGFGYTHIDTANVVQSGSFIYAAPLSTGNPTAQYLMTNTKFEWWNGPNSNNTLGTTKVLEIPDSIFATAYAKFVNCGLAGGTPDTSVYTFDLQGGNYTVEVDGGQWAGSSIQTKATSVSGGFNAWWVKFVNCLTSPSQTINRIAGATGTHHVPVAFNSCSGVANILMRGPGGTYGGGFTGNGKVAGISLDRNQNTKNNDGGLVSGNNTATHAFPCYGQLVLVDKIRVVATGAAGWTGAEVKAFTDAALTAQIGTTVTPAPPSGTWSSPTAYAYEITVPAGTFTSEGVYVTVTNTNASGGVDGLVYVDTLSV